MYQIMDKCVFFVATFIHSFILYRDFFSMKWAGLHPSVFFFIITIVFHLVSLILLSNLLTKWQKAELSYFTTRHSTPLPQNLFFPITFPAMTKRGPPAVQIPFSYLRTSMLVLKRYMKLDVYWAEPGSRSHNPPGIVWSCLLRPDESVNLKGIQCVDVLLLFSLYGAGVGVEREGEGKWRISYWSSARGMGVLYNVELVNCVLWCKDDGNELLFLFYDLSVSVKWITAIYSESKFVCIIVTLTKQKL